MKNLILHKAHRLSAWLLSGTMFIGMSISDLTAATPIVEFNYNQTGTSASNTGSSGGTSTLYDSNNVATDLHSADGTGVSGLSGDRAFDLTASTGIGNASPSQNAGYIADINQLMSFTLTGWYNTAGSAEIQSGTRLVDFTGDGSKLNAGFVLWSSVTGSLVLNVNGTNSGNSDGGTLFSSTNTWVFYAVTYDGTAATDNLKFYAGTDSNSPTLAATMDLNTGTVASISSGTPANDALVIGNNWYRNRGFDGLMDNITIYGSKSNSSGVLDLSAIDTIYDNNLANIPEPSVVSLAALAGAALFVGLKRRRK